MQSSFLDSTQPVTATLSNWVPKCNSELETRLRLDFEIPLSAELLNQAPASVKRAAKLVGDLNAAIPQIPVTTELNQTFEVYPTPDHTVPELSLSNVNVAGMTLFRPTPKDGPSDALFLSFSVNVKSEGSFGDQLVVWAQRHNRRTVFFRAFDVQGTLPGMEKSEAPADKKSPKTPRKSGKDAAVGS